MDDTIYELPDPEQLELSDGLLYLLGVEADDVLDQQFVNKKEQEDGVLEQIQEEYNFDEIKDAFDEETVPNQVKFLYGGDNSYFLQAIEFLLPSSENRECDCNWTRTQNHLVLKQTLNHLAKLAK